MGNRDLRVARRPLGVEVRVSGTRFSSRPALPPCQREIGKSSKAQQSMSRQRWIVDEGGGGREEEVVQGSTRPSVVEVGARLKINGDVRKTVGELSAIDGGSAAEEEAAEFAAVVGEGE